MLGLLSTASLSKAGLKGVNVSRWLSTSPYALSKIIYTETDEAPMLATFSLLPVIQRFAKPMGIEVSPGICISQKKIPPKRNVFMENLHVVSVRLRRETSLWPAV